MPVQARLLTLPWDDLAAAHEERLEAEREGDPERIAAARDSIAFHRERCGELGGFLIQLALEYPSAPLQKVLMETFGQLGIGAFEQAKKAEQRASWALEKLDALSVQVRELQRRLDDRTAGVGEPSRCAEARR
jgi:hypothetical protein